MFNEITKEIELAGRKLTISTGKVARQADGAVMVTYGGTTVLCTVVGAKDVKEGIDFFPLTVHYREMYSAAGKIPGGFFKREGKPSEKEVLTARLIDRPIRPLFPSYFYNETQIICSVMSHDLTNDPDVPAIIGSSAALAISGLPFQSIIAASKVGFINDEFVLNPTFEQLKESKLDLVVAGTDSSVMMVESEAKLLTEQQMLEAVKFGHSEMQPVINMINELKAEAGKPIWNYQAPDFNELKNKIIELAGSQITEAYKIQSKAERKDKLKEIVLDVVEKLSENEQYAKLDIIKNLKNIEAEIVRNNILESSVRIDGRSSTDIRQIVAETSILERTHGSALFTRGETQAIATTTLGTGHDEQLIDCLEGEYKENFMLHYNFPPYSVGEASPMRPTGRREIGHGKLAWRALKAVLPTKEEFPYTMRVVSEITESNGSSSMATVCGGTLSMMDAGVPIKAPVAGIAMGLIKEDDKFVVLSDILGDEDYLGDMDFKVAGTKDGVTALQMDIKITGISFEIMEQALAQAKDGRVHILGKMLEAISETRSELSVYAPSIETITISKDKIKDLIGPGGKNIKEICEKTNAKIDISDDGNVNIATTDGESKKLALKMIKALTDEPELNKIYEGKVVKIMDFGAFINFLGANDGFVHISEVHKDRIANINEHLEAQQTIKVKVIGFERGKAKLSVRQVDQQSGEDLGHLFKKENKESREPRENRDNKDRKNFKNKSKTSNNNEPKQEKADNNTEKKFFN